MWIKSSGALRRSLSRDGELDENEAAQADDHLRQMVTIQTR